MVPLPETDPEQQPMPRASTKSAARGRGTPLQQHRRRFLSLQKGMWALQLLGTLLRCKLTCAHDPDHGKP